MFTVSGKAWIAAVGSVAVLGLGYWLGDVPHRYKAYQSCSAGQRAMLAARWEEALTDFKDAVAQRPTDLGYAIDFDDAQAKWIDTVRRTIDGEPPESQYAYLQGEPAEISKLLIGPNASEFRRLVATVAGEVAADTRTRLAGAEALAGQGKFKEAYSEIDAVRAYAPLVPNFDATIRGVEAAEVRAGIRLALSQASNADFKAAYSTLDSVRAHSGLVSEYGKAVTTVREAEIRWGIAEALRLSDQGKFKLALQDLGSLRAKGLLRPELDSAEARVRSDAQVSSVKELSSAVLRGKAAEVQSIIDSYGQLTGFKFSTRAQTLIDETDFGRFLAALEELHIRPKAGEARNGWLDLVLVKALRNRFSDKAMVSRFLGAMYSSYADQLARLSRPGLALFALRLAKQEGAAVDPGAFRRELAALAAEFRFSVYFPPTTSSVADPGPLLVAPRAATEAYVQKLVGTWMTVSDVPVSKALTSLVVRTQVLAVDVSDNRQSVDKSVQYQSGWETVPNPDYAEVQSELEQAQQTANQVAQEDAENQAQAQSLASSGNLSGLGAALVGVGAGASKVLDSTAQQQVTDLTNKLENTPQTVQKPVYADEPYQEITHNIAYKASYSAAIEVGGEHFLDPATWYSGYSYSALEVVGNAAHNVPVQAPNYQPIAGILQTLSDRVAANITAQPYAVAFGLYRATRWVLARELQMAKPPADVVADSHWGLIELWASSGVIDSPEMSGPASAEARKAIGLE